MPDEFLPETIELIDERAPYVLGATATNYGVWDRDAVEEPLGLFPLDDAGLDRAEALFWELVREERRRRGVWSPILRVVLFVALGLWIVSGLVYDLVNLFWDGNLFGDWVSGPDMVRVAVVNAAIEGIAFKVWIGALVAIVALWLRRNGRVVEQRLTGRTPPAAAAAPEESARP